MPTYSVVALTDLATRALARAGANAAMASITADALVDGELQGLASHGVSRIPQYATHLRNGRADGNAIPAIIRERGGAVLVDARNGHLTSDPKAELTGSMLAMGGTKGAMLALIVELLACALNGAAFGFEGDSFFVDEGNQPNLGQAFLVIDPGAVTGREAYLARVEALIAEMMKDAGVRMPGTRRLELAAQRRVTGVTIPDALAAELETLAR